MYSIILFRSLRKGQSIIISYQWLLRTEGRNVIEKEECERIIWGD